MVNILSVSGKEISIEKKFIQLSEKESIQPAIRSLDLYAGRVLVGTMGSELFYFQSANSP